MPSTKTVGRREFLQLLGVGTVASGFALSTGCGSGSKDATTPGERVLIIGAGVAGLTIGNALTTAGIENVVLEARDRIGGRVHARDVGGVPIDLGGAWISGATGNPATCILNREGLGWTSAEPFGLSTRAFDAQRGQFIDIGTLAVAATVLDQFETARPALLETLGTSATMGDAIELFLSQSGRTGDDRRYAEFALRTLNEIDLAESVDLLSIVPNPSQPLPGGEHFPDGSYRGLVEALARSVDIRLGTVVHRVEHDANGVRIETSNGIEHGSHVVVTVPLGVLKAGTIEFSPPLPAAKRSAVDRLDMASLEKVVLRYDEAFWSEPGSGNFLYMSERPGEFPFIVDYTGYAGGRPTLVALYCGAFRETIASRPEDEIAGRLEAILGEMVGAPGPSPSDRYVTAWKSDPYALGSYLYLPVGGSTADIEALAAPVGERLRFAGEATSVLFNGYVHGAILTGIREAERLLGREGQGVELDSGLVVALGCDETV